MSDYDFKHQIENLTAEQLKSILLSAGKKPEVSKKEQAIAMISAERERQDSKWGYPQNNTPFEWISILGEEFGKLSKAVNDAHIGHEPTQKQLEQIEIKAASVTAVSLAMIEHMLLDLWNRRKS